MSVILQTQPLMSRDSWAQARRQGRCYEEGMDFCWGGADFFAKVMH